MEKQRVKIILLSSNIDTIFTEDQKERIKLLGKVVFVNKIKPLSEVLELYDNDRKIVAIDPDFCNWSVEDEVIDKMKNVQTICLQTNSFSWINVKRAKNRGISVINLKGFHIEAVAEWMIMTALNIARKLPLVIRDDWKFSLKRDMGVEIKGKTAGIIGLGSIGTRICEICHRLGMKVVYWSRKSRDKRFRFIQVEELIKVSDFIFPAWAKNNETMNFLKEKTIRLSKKTAIWIGIYIVNDTLNKKLLIEMVNKGLLYGYGFEEDDANISKYKGNILSMPPLAWYTKESLKRNSYEWMQVIIRAINF